MNFVITLISFLILMIIYPNEVHSQDYCDCCNNYILSDDDKLEQLFLPKKIKEQKIEKINLEYVDSLPGLMQAQLTFNKKGYLIHILEYYDGIPIVFYRYSRNRRGRINQLEQILVDPKGNPNKDFQIYPIKDYYYSKRSLRIKERNLKGEILPDSLTNTTCIIFDSRGREIRYTTKFYYAFNVNGPKTSTFETKTKYFEHEVNEQFYTEDTLTSFKISTLDSSGKIVLATFWGIPPYSTDSILDIEIIYDYDQNNQLVSEISRDVNVDNYFFATECEDQLEYQIHYTYKNGLLSSYRYSHHEKSFTVNCFLTPRRKKN